MLSTWQTGERKRTLSWGGFHFKYWYK